MYKLHKSNNVTFVTTIQNKRSLILNVHCAFYLLFQLGKNYVTLVLLKLIEISVFC